MSEQIGTLSGFCPAKQYPQKIRKVVFYDKEMNRTFVFLSNNIELTAFQIALLYKNRWQIELFFKWIKQYLKIKSFWETTENAVRIQIYSAIISSCFVVIVGHDLQIDLPIYEILQVSGISLFDKTPVKELFNKSENQYVKEQNYNQLSFNFF